MATILLALLLVVVLVALMAVGVMFGRQPIKGSCGGMSALVGRADCEFCGGDRNKCEAAGGDAGRDADADGGGVRQYRPGDR